MMRESKGPMSVDLCSDTDGDVMCDDNDDDEQEDDAGGRRRRRRRDDDCDDGQDIDAGNDGETFRETSPNEWGDAEDVAIRAAMAKATAETTMRGGAYAISAAHHSPTSANDSNDDGDSDDRGGNGVNKSPNEWGTMEDRAIRAAMETAAAATTASLRAGDNDGGGKEDDSSSADADAKDSLENLSESSAIELIEDSDDDDDEYDDDDDHRETTRARPAPPPPRSQYVVETLSVRAQHDAEEECRPFFVDLRTLADQEVLHLRAVGLLPPVSIPAAAAAAAETAATGKGRGVTGGSESDKAEKILGCRSERAKYAGGGVGYDADDKQKHHDDSDENMADNEIEPKDLDSSTSVRLLRDRHASYLSQALSCNQPLARGFASLDASRPWIVYWTMHSLDLLGKLPSEHVLRCAVETLKRCWASTSVQLDASDIRHDPILGRYVVDSHGSDDRKLSIPAGGFGGGPSQMAHCAPTYAAVLALCIVYGAGVDASRTAEMEAVASGHEVKQKEETSDKEKGKEKMGPVDASLPESARAALELLRSKKEELYAWYLSLRTPFLSSSTITKEISIGYRMHHDGEVDVRATYTALAVASLLGLCTDLLFSKEAAAYVAACQTYEGGFGGEPGSEAHGGYTFCAVATLRLLGDKVQRSRERGQKNDGVCLSDTTKRRTRMGSDSVVESEDYRCQGWTVDLEALRGWLARRQMSYEGGFQGRCNKLVDGCYSFWQGGAVAVLDLMMMMTTTTMTTTMSKDNAAGDGRYADDPYASGIGAPLGDETGGDGDKDGLSFDRHMLQRYILLCAQDVNGGLRDKPSKPRDFYHSCYNLSGLSVAQHVLTASGMPPPPSSSFSSSLSSSVSDAGVRLGKEEKQGGGGGGDGWEKGKTRRGAVIWGDEETNEIGATHPVFNVRVERVEAVMEAFGGRSQMMDQ